MKNMERITPTVKLNLKLQCSGHVYVIIVVHIYLGGELVTVIEVAAGGGNKNLQVVFKIVLHLLIA